MKNDPESQRLVPLLVLLILAAAALLRMQNLFSALEYDEIWTLENFSRMPVLKLFRELALPNNQPLNSLWVKFTVLSGLPLWSIRIHSLFAGLSAVGLAGFISYHLAGRRISAALGSMFILALSAPDIAYSALARGYALQVFFLTLYGAGLTAAGFCRPQGKWKQYLPELAVAIGGAGAVLTLPTSIVYLTAITLAAYLIRSGWHLPRRSMLAVFVCGAVLTLCWCLVNYRQLNAARGWGTSIGSFADFYGFLCVTAAQVIGPVVLLIACVAFFTLPRKTLPLLLIIVLPLLSAAVTNAGPPRTYIPFGCVLAIAAGCGISQAVERFKKNAAAVILVFCAVLCIWEYSWRKELWFTPDSREIFKQTASLPYSTLVVHRATNGYPVAWNNQPEIYHDFVKRLLENSTQLLMFDGPGRINGTDSKGSESVLVVRKEGSGSNIAGAHCRIYKLKKMTAAPEPGSMVFAVLRPVQKHIYSAVIRQLYATGVPWLKLNSWLSCPINRPEGSYLYALLAGVAPEKSAISWQGLINNNGMLAFYQLAD